MKQAGVNRDLDMGWFTVKAPPPSNRLLQTRYGRYPRRKPTCPQKHIFSVFISSGICNKLWKNAVGVCWFSPSITLTVDYRWLECPAGFCSPVPLLGKFFFFFFFVFLHFFLLVRKSRETSLNFTSCRCGEQNNCILGVGGLLACGTGGYKSSLLPLSLFLIPQSHFAATAVLRSIITYLIL